MRMCEATMVLAVMIPSTFTSLGGAHDKSVEEKAFNHEENYVSGAVVPFSWEERPGVPLLLGSEFKLELMRKSEEGVIMVNSKASLQKCEREEKELTSKHILLFPLPPPPCSLQISSRNLSICTSSSSKCSIYTSSKANCNICTSSSNSNCKPYSTQCHSCNAENSSTSYLNASNGYALTSPHNTKPALNAHMKKTHISKTSGSSSPPFLTNNTTSSYMGTAIALKDDPFLRAMQACSTKDNYARFGSNYKTGTASIITSKDCDSLISKSFDYAAMAKHASKSFNYGAAANMAKDGTGKSFNYAAMAASKDAGSSKAVAKRRTMKEDNMNIRSIEISDGTTRVPLRRLIMAKEGISCISDHDILSAKSYEGHPAFMVASFQQSPKMMMKKKKPTIAKPAQNHDPNYGCFTCRSIDVNYNSIVRIYNP